jgi:FAD binding domain
MSASVARLKHFGWGREGEGLSEDEEAFMLARAEARFGTALTESASAPRLDEIALAAPRIAAPGSLPFCTSGHYDRTAHTYGKSYPELARGLARDYASAPDVVAYPRDENEVAAVLDWAGSADATVTPFGGGSSVAGGVEQRWSRKSAQADKWNFCLTAGTLCPANQERPCQDDHAGTTHRPSRRGLRLPRSRAIERWLSLLSSSTSTPIRSQRGRRSLRVELPMFSAAAMERRSLPST